MQNDNDFDPGLGSPFSSLATVTTELQTAGPYLRTLLTNPPPSQWTEGFVINMQTQDLHTFPKPPADTQLNAQLFILTNGQYGHSAKQTLSIMKSA